MFVYTLKEFKILDSLCCITADNASNNNTLAKQVLESTNHQFNHNESLLGCMAHVINLAAQDGLKIFGTSEEDPNAEISINSSPMNISNIVLTPDRTRVDLKTVINRIHSLSVHVRGSPQRREVFSGFVQIARTSEAPEDLEAPESEAQTATCLILDVKTRWNSTYMMLNRAYSLRDACNLYTSTPKGSKF